MSNESRVGSDRVTRGLLAVIAAGIWALVALLAWQGATLRELATEVAAIGADTQAIHDDLDPPADDEVEHGVTSRRHGAGSLARLQAAQLRRTTAE